MPVTVRSSPTVSNPLIQSPWNSTLPEKASLSDSAPLPTEVIDGVAMVTVPDAVLENSQPLWSNYIVGYFIGDAPHIGKVHKTVNRIWVSPEAPLKIDAQFIHAKTVLFKIENAQTRSRVLRRHFWHISDIPMVVREWNPSASSYKPDMSSMPIWVDLQKVPDHLFSHKGLMFLGNTIGSAQKLHPNTERCVRLDVARILVVVNLDKPLPDSICLNSNPATIINVSYPWLPPRCVSCQSWGHLENDCSLMRKGSAIAVDTNSTLLGKSPSPVVAKDPNVGSSDLEANLAAGLPSGENSNSLASAAETEVVGRSPEEEAKQTADQSWTVVESQGRRSPRNSPARIVQNVLPSGQEIHTSPPPTGFSILATVSEEDFTSHGVHGAEEGEIVGDTLEDVTSENGDEVVSTDVMLAEVVHSHNKFSRGKQITRKPTLTKKDKILALNNQSKKASGRKH